MKRLGGGLAVFLIAALLYDRVQQTWVLYVGCFGMLIFLLWLGIASLPTEGARRRRRLSRINTEREMLQEHGLLPYSHLQLQQEREAYNKNAASLAFWADSKTYIDYDGAIRNVATDEIIDFAYRRKP